MILKTYLWSHVRAAKEKPVQRPILRSGIRPTGMHGRGEGYERLSHAHRNGMRL